ncbi:MAG: iron-containing alcohol dehydrogenase family protein [Pseudanabaenaceae cyanobacterium]
MAKVILQVAPAQVVRGQGVVGTILADYLNYLFVGGKQALAKLSEIIAPVHQAEPIAECTEQVLASLQTQVHQLKPEGIVAVGGGKVMDCAKLLADRCQLPIVTVPTSAATCASWTALSNVYGANHEFLYDVGLARCPELLVIDYDLIATAPRRTLIAGIGDAIAKWYEASVSSGTSTETMTIAAVQTARVLRDILFQKAELALADPQPSNPPWQEVVDANICLAGVIGGMGGANCRTVAAHAIHNALTHLPASFQTLHGEKVAYGILVQLRLEEQQGNQLATTARQQLLKFYQGIGLPKTLAELGLADISLTQLQTVATLACQPRSDIHRLPFPVSPTLVMSAMVSTAAHWQETPVS